MAMSRNARRLAAKLRNARRETDALNSEAVRERNAKVRENLSRSPRREHSSGLVSAIYSGAGNPVGFTRPLRYRKRAGECRSVVATGSAL